MRTMNLATHPLSTVSRKTKRVARTMSLDQKVRGFLRQSVLKSNKATYQPTDKQNERNIFASDMISQSYILTELKEIRKDASITALEVEDFLLSSHQTLSPVFKGLMICGNRDWKSIRFQESVEADTFAFWQEAKRSMIDDFDETLDDTSSLKKVLTFHANIHVDKETPYYALLEIFKNLYLDNTVLSICFEGNLCGCEDKNIPARLRDLIDKESGLLLDDIKLSVKCGWPRATGFTKIDSPSSAFALLKECIREFHCILRVKRNAGKKLRRPSVTTDFQDEEEIEEGLTSETGSETEESKEMPATTALSQIVRSERRRQDRPRRSSDVQDRRVRQPLRRTKSADVVRSDSRRQLLAAVQKRRSIRRMQLERSLSSSKNLCVADSDSELKKDVLNTGDCSPHSLDKSDSVNKREKASYSFRSMRSLGVPGVKQPLGLRTSSQSVRGSRTVGGIDALARSHSYHSRSLNIDSFPAATAVEKKCVRPRSKSLVEGIKTDVGKRSIRPRSKSLVEGRGLPDYDWTSGSYTRNIPTPHAA